MQQCAVIGCLFVLGLGLDVNHEVHSLSLPDNHYCICRVPRGHELPLWLCRSILGAETGCTIKDLKMEGDHRKLRTEIGN